MVLNLKMDYNLTNKYYSKSVFFFWRYHSFNPMIFIRSSCQRLIVGLLAAMEKPVIKWKRKKRTPLNNLDQKRGEGSCTIDYLLSFGYDKGTRQN